MKRYKVKVTATVEVWADNEDTAKMTAQGYVCSLSSFKSIRLIGIGEEVKVNELP